MSTELQHALLVLAIAATAYLEWRRSRERRQEEEEHAQRLRDAAEKLSDR